jgi:hypothetical protein
VTVGIRLAGENIGRQLSQRAKQWSDRIIRATRDAARETAAFIKEEGDRDISEAGNFGPRWNEAFRATVQESDQGRVININVTFAIPYWTVHEYGAVIKGRPLLWIPFSDAADAQGVNARDYPGRLFRVPRDPDEMQRKDGGAPLLFSYDGEPKYSGHESVTIPRRFHIRDVIRSSAIVFRGLYRHNMAKAR